MFYTIIVITEVLFEVFSNEHQLTGGRDLCAGTIDKRPHFKWKRVKIFFHLRIFIFHLHHPAIVCPASVPSYRFSLRKILLFYVK